MLTLRLTETEAKALDQCVKLGFYPSRSAAVRAALMILFENHRLKREAMDDIEDERRKAKPRRSNLRERVK